MKISFLAKFPSVFLARPSDVFGIAPDDANGSSSEGCILGNTDHKEIYTGRGSEKLSSGSLSGRR